MADNNINVGGRLHSIATGNVLTGANEVFDDYKNKKQNVINTETDNRVTTVENDINTPSSGIKARVATLESQVAFDGDFQAENTPEGIVSGSGKITTANAVAGALSTIKATTDAAIGYYTCDTAAATAAKVVTADGYVLKTGGSIKIKFTERNSANNATLKIGSAAAKALFYNGARAAAGNTWDAGETVEVYYDGVQYMANNVAGSSGDGAFDVSAYNDGGEYESLGAALAGVPQSKRKGGMRVKFIQLTPATYSVVKTEGLTEEPAGTEVQEGLAIESGSYTAAQLPVEAPATTVTYWMAVTVDEVTTYTTWVITKATGDVRRYVEYRLMSTGWSTAVGDWQGVDDEPVAGSENLVKSGGVQAVEADTLADVGYEVVRFASAGRSLLESGKFGGTSYAHGVVPVVAGEKFVVENYSETTDTVRYCFAVSDEVPASLEIPLVEGTSVVSVGHQTKVAVTIPAGCRYLLFNAGSNYNSRLYKVDNGGDDVLKMVGGGADTASYSRVSGNVTVGNMYRVWVRNQGVSATRFFVYALKVVDGAESTEALVSLQDDTNGIILDKYYDVVIPADTVGVYATSRFAVGERQECVLEDITVADGISISKRNVKTKSYTLLANGNFGSNSNYRHSVIPVKLGEKYAIRNASTDSTAVRYCFATSDYSTASAAIPLLENTSVVDVSPQDIVIIDIPEGCNFLLATYNDNTQIGENTELIDAIDSTATFASGEKVHAVGIDAVPTEGSSDLVTSGGVHSSVTALKGGLAEEIQTLHKEITDYVLYSYPLLNTGKFGGNRAETHTAFAVNAGDEFIILNTGTQDNVRYAFTKTNEYAASADIPFADNYSDVFVVAAGDFVRVRVPDDDESIHYLLCNAGSYPAAFYGKDNPFAYTDGVVKELEYATNEKLSELYVTKDVIDLTNIEALLTRRGVFRTGTWTQGENSDTDYRHLLVDVFGEDCLLQITANSEMPCYVAFLRNLSVPRTSNTVPFVDGTSSITIPTSETKYLFVPKSCVTIAIYLGNSEDDYPYSPSSLVVYRNKGIRDIDGVVVPANYLYAKGTTTTNTVLAQAVNGYSYCVKVRKGDNFDVNFVTAGGNSRYFSFTKDMPSPRVLCYDLYTSTYNCFLKHFTAPFDGWFVTTTYYKENTFEILNYKSGVCSQTAKSSEATIENYLRTLSYEEVEYGSIDKQRASFLSTGYYGGNTSYLCGFADISTATFVKITANENNNALIGFVATKSFELDGVPDYISSSRGVITIPAGETKVFEVRGDSKYVLLNIGATGTLAYLPKFIGLYVNTRSDKSFSSYEQLVIDFNARRDRQVTNMLAIGMSPLNPPTDSDGWELPTTLQQLNAQKKAEQLINIRWTPKWNVPSKKAGIYPANVEVTTGIPYSSNNDDGSKTVGEEVTLYTFMTAIDNPYSQIYTECVNNGNVHPSTNYPNAPVQKSYWGKVYSLSSNGFAYYGTVCCGLTSSVENSPLKWNNGILRDYKLTNGVYVPICPAGTVDFNLLKIGDICDNTTHSFMIYGLHRDANGEVDKVIKAESTGGAGAGVCRLYTYTSRQAFVNAINLSGNPYVILRYMNLWDNTDYEPSEFVPLTDRGETATTVTYNNAICTYSGDKATFRETDLVVINYNLYGTQTHDWTKIQVYKDDVLLSEYTLAEAEQTLVDYLTNNSVTPAPFNEGIDEHNHALVLGKFLSAGMYKACMADDNENTSDYTYWEVISNGVTVKEAGVDEYEVTVGGKYLIQAIYINGISMYYLPTLEEQMDRKFIVRPQALSKLYGKPFDSYHVAVKLKGEYGNVTTVPVYLYGSDVPAEDEEDDDEAND